jgi:hypothetical protein
MDGRLVGLLPVILSKSVRYLEAPWRISCDEGPFYEKSDKTACKYIYTVDPLLNPFPIQFELSHAL